MEKLIEDRVVNLKESYKKLVEQRATIEKQIFATEGAIITLEDLLKKENEKKPKKK